MQRLLKSLIFIIDSKDVGVFTNNIYGLDLITTPTAEKHGNHLWSIFYAKNYIMAKRESFRQITGYHGDYSVSNLARVRNNTTGVILTPFQKDNTKMGKKFENYKVGLCKGGKVVKVKVARLVAQEFIINVNPVRNKLVLHRDETLSLELMNRPENLFWGNNKDNSEDMIRKGRGRKKKQA